MPTWLSKAMRERLREQRVPFYQLRDGPERMENLPTAEPHIVLQRDDNSGDAFIRPPGTSAVNPGTFRVQQIGMELLVFARGPVSGASTLDHEDQGDAVVHQLMRALYRILTRNRWDVRRAGYLTKAQVAELGYGGWPGRIYQLLFTVNVGLTDVDYKGAALEEFEMGPGGVPFELDTDVEGGQGGRELPRATTEV
jgi:hypothetical protein